MKCTKRRKPAVKDKSQNTDTNAPEKEIKPIYTAEEDPNMPKKVTYSAQYESPRLACQQTSTNSANVSCCSCNPQPLYLPSKVPEASPPYNSNIPPQCSCGNIPPPYPPNDDLWNLQFCRWWGWNWIRKREEEMMKKQNELAEIKRENKEETFKKSKSKTRKKAPKKDDFFSWCSKFCKAGKRKPLKAKEKQQLKELYVTPCSSVICPCGLKDVQSQSVHFIGEYECRCSSTRQICTPVSIVPSKTRRQQCKYNMRKHQSWICEKTESSSSEEFYPHVCPCSRKPTDSSAEESIEYLSLRMERIRSDEDDTGCECVSEKHYRKSPCCPCKTKENSCRCQQTRAPAECNCHCEGYQHVCPAKHTKPSPRKCASPARIPKFRRYDLPHDYQQPCGYQQNRKHVHPCVYRTPKCIQKHVKPVKCCCGQNKMEYSVCCPSQESKKPVKCCCGQNKMEYSVCCPCQESKRKKKSKKFKCVDVILKTADKSEKKCICRTDVSKNDNDVSQKSCNDNNKTPNKEAKKDNKEAEDKTMNCQCTANDCQTKPNLNCKMRNTNNQGNFNQQDLCQKPYLLCFNDNSSDGQCLKNNFLYNVMMNNSVSQALKAGLYASPASGRMYNLETKTFAAKSLSHRTRLPQPIDIEQKKFPGNIDLFQLSKAHEEHRLLLTAVCEAILSSRTPNKESNVEVHSEWNVSADSYDSLHVNEEFTPLKNNCTNGYSEVSNKNYNHDFLYYGDKDEPDYNEFKSDIKNNTTSKLPFYANNEYDVITNYVNIPNFIPPASHLLKSVHNKYKNKNELKNAARSVIQKFRNNKRTYKKSAYKKNFLLNNAELNRRTSLPTLIEENSVRNLCNNIRNSSESAYMINNVAMNPSPVKKDIITQNCCSLQEKENITPEYMYNLHKNANIRNNTLPRHLLKYDTSEAYTKPTLDPSNNCIELPDPKNVFLDTSFKIPPNISMSKLFCSVSMSKEINSKFGDKKETFNKNVFEEVHSINLEKFKKQQLYNILFSTVHPDFGNDFPNLSTNSGPAASPAYPSAVIEELPSPHNHEQTQTSEFFLRQPVLICHNNSEKKLCTVNINDKYSFLSNISQETETKDLIKTNTTTTQNSFISSKSSALENELSHTHLSKDAFHSCCVSATSFEKNLRTYKSQDKEYYPQNILMAVAQQHYKTNTVTTKQQSNQAISNIEKQPAALFIVDQPELELLCTNPNLLSSRSTTPNATSNNEESIDEQEINRHYFKDPETNTDAKSEFEYFINKHDKVFHSCHSLTNKICTEEPLKHAYSENELLCFSLDSDFTHFPQSGLLVTETQNTTNFNEKKDPSQTSDFSSIARCTSADLLETNLNKEQIIPNVQESSIKSTDNNEYLNDLRFIEKNLPGYTSISDISSIKSSLYKTVTNIPITEPQNFPQTHFINTSTSPIRILYSQTPKSYVESTTSPFKFEAVHKQLKDKYVVSKKRNVLQQESPFSMFCVPVREQNIAGPSTPISSSTALSRPERSLILNKTKTLKTREKRWPY